MIFLLRRLAGMGLTLLVVSLVVWLALEATPGDAAMALAGESASAAQVASLRTDLGLDRPLPARFLDFLQGAVLRGDLGRSFVSGRPVAELLRERLPYTLVLALCATLCACLLGSAIGITAARRAGSWLDTLLMGGTALGLAVPSFWSALLLMMVFSVWLRVLPVSGASGPQSLVLPSLTLALPAMAAIARLLRSSLLDVARSDYIRTAHAKGLPPQQILTRHVLRSSLIPVITTLGVHLGYLLGGAFIVETIFGWPGLGRMLVLAIFDRDYPVVIGASLCVAVLVMGVNLLVDLAHGWLDPQAGLAAL